MKAIQDAIKAGYSVGFTPVIGDRVNIRLIKSETHSHWTHTVDRKKLDDTVVADAIADGIKSIKEADAKPLSQK